ncbi:hybrid sensor histidine kinase/response regulator [Thiorhodovibrio frisius]|uniref:histidine kinase n=1 Tax=Thiorhodovibrio frisius TaxID=631362 RepID=H8YYN8_9GAMM|nr:hybrid sensor histidine kinase/response regulator [Thiorhodovibrio frisius]EIC23564.1 response regulator containing a CheY-like receiver domain and an HD-GYP domain [Thiorhodovibrio frisius]WPL23348.1 Stalked cell differentiation-controlling protein [Thiorhodovibrio frisius]
MRDNHRPTVLIVDDTPENLDILVAALSGRYSVAAARDGERALKVARRQPPPAIILLDIMMPGIDGYEVCRQLKADAATRDIPVLFLTALADVDSETKGLELGAVDYIHKPISVPLVQVRVATHLALAQARHQLALQVEELVAAARLRDDVDRILRHDLKGPLNPVIGFADLLRDEPELNKEQRECMDLIHGAGLKMLDMINRSLDLYKMEQGSYELIPQPVELLPLLQRVARDLDFQVQQKHLSIASEGEAGHLLGDEMLCYSLFCNLIKNAIEASPEQGQITVTVADAAPGWVVASIHNQGAVPASIREHFFDKYVTAGKSSGTGLGTYSARLMASTQHGDIAMESSEDVGTTLTVRLPAATANYDT